MLNNIYKSIVLISGNKELFFDTPLVIKMGVMPNIHLYGAAADAQGHVYVMDVESRWHQVEQTEADAPVLDELYTRVCYLIQSENTKQTEVYD